MNKHFIVASTALLISTSFNATSSENNPITSGVSVAAGVGYYKFDSDRNLDDDILGSIALGYQFDNPWGLELVYLNADTDADSGSAVDVSQWRLDALYHFNQHDNWLPYVAIGAGEMETEISNFSSKESIVNAGGGIKYYITQALSLRSDLRFINSLDNEMNDVALTVGLNYIFGQAPKKVAQVTPPPPVQPVVKVSDRDKDGVTDGMDNCPNTPANFAVNTKGCALDDDKDGVANTIDQCPNTSAGAKVDTRGCYQMLTETKEVQLSVNFANNSAEVQQADYPEIQSVATFMTEFPNTNVVIEGHTDDRGNSDYNQQLSEKRAQAVAQVLVTQFSIDQSRVSSIGYGEQRPITSNDTAEQRAKNRRVIAVVKATTQSIAK